MKHTKAEKLFNKGMTFFNQNKYEEAEFCYRKAIQLKSDDVWYQFELGVCCKYQGKIEEAKLYFEEAMKLESDYTGFSFVPGWQKR